MKNEDRRIRKTEDALLCALAELLNVKPLHKITVNELVRLADLHRSTFYTHYTDIYDLYHQTEARFLSVYQTYVREYSTHDYTGVFRGIVTYLDENRTIAGMFLGKNAEPSFRHQLTRFVTEQYICICAYEDNRTVVPEEWNSIAAYHVGGMINLLANWIQSGYSQPKEKMIDLLLQFDYGMASFRRRELL